VVGVIRSRDSADGTEVCQYFGLFITEDREHLARCECSNHHGVCDGYGYKITVRCGISLFISRRTCESVAQ
jgi:hypothetical protein